MKNSKIIALASSLLCLGSASTAQAANPGRSQRVTITLSNFKFLPAVVTLHHGQPYILVFANAATGGHDFVAKRFFAAATIDPAEVRRIPGGEVALDGGQSKEVHIIAPPAGTYEAHCSHFMHSAFGMKGSIIVD